MVAPAGVKSWAWPVAAALAAGFVALLAFHGERPQPGLARFKPAGLLADWPLQQVVSVEVGSGADHLSFHRNPAGDWRQRAADMAITADLAQRIETGLSLLHNSAPQRTDLVNDHSGEFGLEPPRLTVTAHTNGGAVITVEFGDSNPLGLERYARIVGKDEVLLMPAYVAEAWEKVAEAQ